MENGTEILMLIGTIVLIIIVGMSLIQQMDVAYYNYVEENCIKDNGTLVFYECFNGFWMNDCEKVGAWCKLENGTKIQYPVDLTWYYLQVQKD